jgi:hypothetical protein
MSMSQETLVCGGRLPVNLDCEGPLKAGGQMTAAVCRHTTFTPALPALYCLEFVCNIIARYACFALDFFARPICVWIASLTLAMTTSRTTRQPTRLWIASARTRLAMTTPRTTRGRLSAAASSALGCHAACAARNDGLARTLSRTLRNLLSAASSLLITPCSLFIRPQGRFPGTHRNRLLGASPPPPLT